jgi:hypothetical protein
MARCRNDASDCSKSYVRPSRHKIFLGDWSVSYRKQASYWLCTGGCS